jgi:tyrosyl-tRNA synthetase
MSLQDEFDQLQSQVEKDQEYLCKGAAEVIPGKRMGPHLPSAPSREETLGDKLARSIQQKKPLRVKLGVDPTAPDLHLGHTVVLRKLKHFQDLGHTAVFLIGDFTAMVGDPTGQSETRPRLTPEQIEANTTTYLDQVYKILDHDKTEVRRNSEWLGELKGADFLTLCSRYSLARMLEREDFRSRLSADRAKANLSSGWKGQNFTPPLAGRSQSSKVLPETIFIHELLYPLLQAYDSVELRADVELGATEQKFNLLVGRDIQRAYGLIPQVALTMPILVGLDGERKMSKSLSNYVGITEAPGEMFGKLMSIPDSLIWTYYELLTDKTEGDLELLRKDVMDGNQNPRDVKLTLAWNIVSEFHGIAAAGEAQAEFRRVFQQRLTPEKIPVSKQRRGQPKRLSALLVELKLVRSRSEAERLIKQGGVEVDGARVDDVKRELDLQRPGEFLLRAGKRRFLRLIVE